MARHLIGRLSLLVLVAFVVSLLVFVLQYVIPGDPARALAPRAGNQEAVETIRKELHLDDPLWVQITDYYAGLVQGDLGTSYVQREAVLTLIAGRVPTTLLLAACGVLVEVMIGVPLGLWAATTRTGRRTATTLNLALLSIPSFVLGLVLLLVFGFTLNLAPVVGGAGASQLILPALTLGLVGVPYVSQIVAEETTQALASDYVRTAIAKGLPNGRIVFRHALRNALPPVVTMVGLDLGIYISGVIVVEAVFGWPGVGQLAVQSLESLDRPVVLGLTLLTAMAVSLFNLLADLARMVVDPRSRSHTS